MPCETDPLLPQNEPSPEIQVAGGGVSKSTSAEITFSDALPAYEDAADGDSNLLDPEDGSLRSALSTVCSFFTLVVFFALVIGLASPDGLRNLQPAPEPAPSRPGRTIEQRVSKILDETPLVDGHNDLAIVLRLLYQNHINKKEFRDRFENGGMDLHIDLPRLKEGKVGGAFWSAFIPCPSNASQDFSDENYAEAVTSTLAQIDLIRRLQHHYPDIFTPAQSTPSHALSAFSSNKSLVSPISIEGLHQIPPSAPFSTLRLYHSLGVRSATLTWNCHNAFADAALITINGSTVPAPYHRGGLTEAGRGVIREMNRLGMLVDLSHTSYWTQRAVMTNKTSLAPVIYSHSSAFALCQHPRNVHDDMLDLVKSTNSLVMVNFAPEFISCLPSGNASELPKDYERNNTLHQVARHIVHIGNKIGYGHVGLGSDFDGILSTPRGLEGVDKYPDLVAELLRMGVPDVEVSKVVGGNILRVWLKAEEVANKMHEDGALEAEDEVKPQPREQELTHLKAL